MFEISQLPVKPYFLFFGLTPIPLDYLDTKDGEIDSILRCEDLYKVIRRGGKTVHLKTDVRVRP